MAFSPGACVVAIRQPDGQLKLENMQSMHGSLVDMKEDDGEQSMGIMFVFWLTSFLAKHDAIAAVFALQYASASMQYKSTDDILSILPSNASKSIPLSSLAYTCQMLTFDIALTHQMVLLTTKFLNVNFDYGEENQKQLTQLFRNNTLFKCLSLQNALGSADEGGPRKLTARLSWITMNLRLVSFNINIMRSNEKLSAGESFLQVGSVGTLTNSIRNGNLVRRPCQMVDGLMHLSTTGAFRRLLRHQTRGSRRATGQRPRPGVDTS